MVKDGNVPVHQTLPLEQGRRRGHGCPALQSCVWVLVRRRGSVGHCSFLVGLKEMTLLSGFDQRGPCSYVASMNGKSQGEAGQDRFPEPSGWRQGWGYPGNSSVVLNLGLSWLQFGRRLVVRDEQEGLARIQCLES